MNPAVILNVIIAIVVLFLIDLYAYQGVVSALSSFQSPDFVKGVRIVYWIISLGLLLWIAITMLGFSRLRGPDKSIYFLFGTLILFLVPKIILLTFMFGEDVFRILRSGWLFIYDKLYPSGDSPVRLESRRAFVGQIAIGLASIPFFSILYGITKGKYNFKIHKADIAFDDLPESFNGFKIVQISDVHAGSHNGVEEIKKGLKMIMDQKPDMILFTGDLVNNLASEMDPFISAFSKLSAPFGKYSILGNHDYSDYIPWEVPEEKERNMMRLLEIHKEMGFTLLKNENLTIVKNDGSLRLIGVENWGAGGFTKYGDLEKSVQGVNKNEFKILMSHDPSHWEHKILPHDFPFHLTLSGHTHGMQFGIEIPGIKWSPVKYRYPRWAGLYKENGQYLYVNRGFGFIGFPGRVGIWPEISVITLLKK